MGGAVPSTLVSALNSGPSSLSASHGWGHGVVFLGKTHYSHIASLHVGVLVIGTDKFNAGCYPAMDSNPIQGVAEILLVTYCYRWGDTLLLSLVQRHHPMTLARVQTQATQAQAQRAKVK